MSYHDFGYYDPPQVWPNLALPGSSSILASANLSIVGGMMASWLVGSTPEQAVQVRALARDIALCSWERHFILTVPLSTQVYKWEPANLVLRGNPVMD